MRPHRSGGPACALAGAVDNSQFEGKAKVAMGARSVWPSTLKIQLMFAGMVAAISGVFANTIVTRVAQRESVFLEDNLTTDH